MENKLVTYKITPALAFDTKFLCVCINMSKIYFKIVSSRVGMTEVTTDTTDRNDRPVAVGGIG